MNRKIIALDLDGTLLNNDGKISEISKKYLEKLKKEGHIVAIVTGRILKRALFGTDGAEFANYIVSDTGAAFFKKDNKEWKEIYSFTISKELAKEILQYYGKDKFVSIDLCNKDGIYKYDGSVDMKKFLENISQITHITTGFLNNDFAIEYLQIFKSKFPSLEMGLMQDSFGNKRWIDIVQKGVEKYKGIVEIAKLEKISNKDIVAFGDGLNDIEMLKKCGVGVAMKNALPEVKEKANYITCKTNDENGVVEFLNDYLN